MLTVAECQARHALLPEADTARLDIDWLLLHVLDQSRASLYAYPEQALTPDQSERFEGLFERRINGEPVAYLLGEAEFWGLSLEVNPSTLIPRPDTELLVEWLLERFPDNTPQAVLDLGTGTGAIALALAKERSCWRVSGVDASAEAVALARRNQQRLGLANAVFGESDWFGAVERQPYALIVSNPPYIEADDEHLQRGGVRFEPRSALVSGRDGLEAIRHITGQAPNYLAKGGVLLFEHGYRQAEAVAAILRENGFGAIESRCDYGGNPRATLGYA